MVFIRSLASFILIFVALFSSFTSAAFAEDRIKLRLLGDINWPTGSISHGTQVGGLSGLSFDRKSGKLLAISDDRSEINPARVYVLGVGLPPYYPFSLGIHEVIYLKNTSGELFAESSVDPEAIAALSLKKMFFATEGDAAYPPKTPRTTPGIYAFDVNAGISHQVPVSEKFVPEAEVNARRGARNNVGFESLTLQPNHKILYAANEDALVQDGDPSSLDSGSRVRILELKLSKNEIRPVREFVYELDRAPSPRDFQANKGSSSLGELVALGELRFLALERSFTAETVGAGHPDYKGVYVTKASRSAARIFEVSCQGATDVIGIPSLRVAALPVIPCRKRLVLDLDSIIPRLSPGFQSIDNMEGMTLGPRLPNGNHTLIVVSDNNFNPKQRTQFLAFEIMTNDP
jgi:hypothetical protein